MGKTASALLLFASATALALDPLAAIPFVFWFLAIVAVAALLAAIVKGVVTIFDNGERLLPSPVAIGTLSRRHVARAAPTHWRRPGLDRNRPCRYRSGRTCATGHRSAVHR